ncbi:hypothetical protein PHYC_01023 [Phycisphaerales bacterium]|nr:hypothetical protein PHYC_01023 [Phycisphaerales bacterium]
MASRITISLSKRLQTWLERQVEGSGFASSEDYIRHLLRMAQASVTVDEIDRRLIESESSGPARRVTRGDWSRLARRGDRRAVELRRQISQA